MRILLDADTLLEFILNRSKFIGKVEYLAEIFGANSSIQLYLSKPGLDKIVSLQALNEKESEQLVTGLKKRIKILRVTKAVAKKARSSSAIDYESAVEIHLAIKANIGAIVTHKPSDFSSEELSIITLSDLQQRKHLEDNLSKNIKDLPAVFVINSEQISNLEKAFYHLPSYTGVKSLEPKESSHQLDLTCSLDKVSSPSGDNSSPRSTHTRSLQQFILDPLLQPAIDRATAYSNVLKYNSIATAHLAHEKYLDDLRKSIFGDIQKHSDALFAAGKEHSSLVARLSSQSKTSQLINQANLVKLRDLATESLTLGSSYNGLNSGVAISEIQSSLVDRLSIKPPLTQSIAHPDTAQFGNLAASMQVCKSHLDNFTESILSVGKANSLLTNRLLPEPLVARPTAQADIQNQNISDLATGCQTYKSSIAILNKSILQNGKAYSVIADSLSRQNELISSVIKANNPILSNLAATCKAHSSLIDRLLPPPLVTRSTGKIDVLKPDTLAIAYQTAKNHRDNLATGIFQDVGLHCSLVDRLSPQPKINKSTPQTGIHKLNSLTVEHLALKNSIVGLNVDVCQFSKIQSSLVDSSSIEPKIFARSIAQLEAARFSGLATERLTCTSSLDTLKERIDRSSPINPLLKVDRSFSDRAGLLSQIKLLESMEKANTLESYLSRKN